MNIVAMVLILTPSVPPVLRAMFAIPNAALQNAMASRVYRQLKLGLIKEDDSTLVRSTSTSTTNRIRFASTSKFSAGNGSSRRSEVESVEMTGSARSQKVEKGLIVRVDVDEETDMGLESVKRDRHDWEAGDFA